MRRAMAHDSAARVRDGSRGRGLALSPRPLYPPKADRSRAVERELESLSAKFGFRTETEEGRRGIAIDPSFERSVLRDHRPSLPGRMDSITCRAVPRMTPTSSGSPLASASEKFRAC